MERIDESERMRSLVFSLAIALMGCGASNATASTTPTNASSTNGAQSSGVTFTFPEYTAALLQEVLPEVCGNPHSMLRTCFTVDEVQCRQHFGDAMMACSEREGLHWPTTVTEANGDETSQALAMCAGWPTSAC